MATSRNVISRSRVVLNVRRFCTVEKTEPFYMSGYQAKQKKLTKIKLSKLEWKPEGLMLDENKWIMDTTKPHEVINIVTEALKQRNLEKIQMSSIYNSGIRKCVELGGYPQCWTLFVCAKKTEHITTQIYTTMIWMNLNSSKRAHFNKAFELYKEMKMYGFAVSNHTYSALINGSAKKLCYNQGIEIWKDMQKDNNIMIDIHGWNAIIMLYSFNKDMIFAAKMYDDMINKAHIIPDHFTFTALLNGYSASISNAIKWKNKNIQNIDIDEYIIMAENIFYDAITSKTSIINNHVIQSWMNVYAANGDIYSCLIIFKWLLKINQIEFKYDIKIKSKKKQKKIKIIEEWLNDDENKLNKNKYKLRIQIFGIVLKACLNNTKLIDDELMNIIKPFMDIMLNNKCDITPSTDIYGILFQLYRRMINIVSIDELGQLYDEMKLKCNSNPTERELNEYGRTYLSFMDYHGFNNDKKQDFIAILINEFKQMKVTPSIYTKQLIQEYSN